MKESIYLGNGCLEMTTEHNKLFFTNWAVVTSQEVGCCKYEIVSNPFGLNTITSEDITKPNEGGGDITESELVVTMTTNSSVVVLCNKQNVIDSYVEIVCNENNKISFKVIAEQCYYTNNFQARIEDNECTEEEFEEFVSSFLVLELESNQNIMTIEDKLNMAKELVKEYKKGKKSYNDLKVNERSFDFIVSKDKPYLLGENKITSIEVGDYGVVGHYFSESHYRTLVL